MCFLKIALGVGQTQNLLVLIYFISQNSALDLSATASPFNYKRFVLQGTGTCC